MDNKTKEILIGNISERLISELYKIKKLSTSTADDYGNNITYFRDLIRTELNKIYVK